MKKDYSDSLSNEVTKTENSKEDDTKPENLEENTYSFTLNTRDLIAITMVIFFFVVVAFKVCFLF